MIRPKFFESKIVIYTKRLESFINGNIKCLKLEAEGAETEILEGLGDKLKFIKYISADLGFERGVNEESTLAAVSNFLLSNNFEILAIGKKRLCVLFKNIEL